MSSNPFLRKRRKAQPAQEDYSPEEQNNLLKSLGSSSLSGLNYVGGYLDKQLGARALRGALAGKPRELLSLIPGSDTVGLTDKKDSTTGKELTGWDDPNSWMDDITGFGLEVALDPSWLVGAGAVNAGGKALKAAGLAGKVAKLSQSSTKAARLAGNAKRFVGPLETKLTRTARDVLEEGTKLPGGQLAHGAVAGTGRLPTTFPKELEAFQRAATGMGKNAADILDEPLKASIAKIGLPGMKPWLEIGKGTSPRALKVAGALDKAGKAIRFNAPMRTAAQLFDAKSMGMESEWAQRLGKDIAEGLPGVRREALEGSGVSIAEMGEKGLLDPQSGRAIRRQMEGWEAATPDTAPIIGRERTGIEEGFQEGLRWGAAGERLKDPLMPQYAPRGMASNKFKNAVMKALKAVLGKDAPTDFARADFLKKIVGGTDALEHSLIRNPSYVGPNKDPLKVAMAGIKQSGLAPLHTKKEVRQLAKWLGKLPDTVLGEGFYKNAIESSRDYKVKLGEKTFKAKKTIESIADQIGRHVQTGEGVEVHKVLKNLKLRRGGLAPSQFKALATEVKNGTKSITDFVREVDRLENGAFARIGEMLDTPISNPTRAVAQQLRGGTMTVDDAVKEISRWQKQVASLKVSPEAAAEYTRINEFFKGPKAASKVLKHLDSYLNLFKAGVLTWPARYVRDLASGTVQNILHGEFSWGMFKTSRDIIQGKQIPLEQALAIPVVKEMLAKEGLPATVENANRMLRAHLSAMELIGERVADVSQVGGPKAVQGIQNLHQQIPGVNPLTLKGAGKEAIDLKAWKEYGKQVRPHKPSTYGVRGVADAEETTNPLLKAGNTTGTMIDALNRLPAYLSQLKRGVDPAAAKAKVMAMHVDYSNRALTATERQIMTRAFPFYRYSRHMAEFTFNELLKNPKGPTAQVVRGGTRIQASSPEGEVVPEHVARTLSIPMPNIPGLKAPEGNTRYLTGLGLMHEDPLSLFQPGSSAFHTARSTGQSLIGRLNPLAKAPLELAFGKQAFSGRELEDLDPNLGRIAANVTGKDTPYRTPILLEQAVANSPAARAVSSLRTITDTRPGSFSKSLTNLASGVKLTDIENEKARNLAQRKLLEELLRGAPGVHRFEHLFAPDDSKLSEREQQIMKLYRQLSKQSAKKAREKKKAEGK